MALLFELSDAVHCTVVEPIGYEPEASAVHCPVAVVSSLLQMVTALVFEPSVAVAMKPVTVPVALPGSALITAGETG